jgi:hypothetical protein
VVSFQVRKGGISVPFSCINSITTQLRTVMEPRIYTYKITFEEVPYYYYGVKKEKYFNEYYMGSPKTHKWCWELYTPKKQILQLFDFTDDGWIEAQEVEKRLIKPFYNTDKWCLNENCGGRISLQINRDTAKKVGEDNRRLSRGIFGMSEEEKFIQRSNAGKISGNLTKERGTGIFGMSEEEKMEASRKGAKLGGKKTKELGTGIFAMSQEEKMEANRKGAKVLNTTKWKCNITGYVSTSGPLTLYQKHKGIDPTNRTKV